MCGAGAGGARTTVAGAGALAGVSFLPSRPRLRLRLRLRLCLWLFLAACFFLALVFFFFFFLFFFSVKCEMVSPRAKVGNDTRECGHERASTFSLLFFSSSLSLSLSLSLLLSLLLLLLLLPPRLPKNTQTQKSENEMVVGGKKTRKRKGQTTQPTPNQPRRAWRSLLRPRARSFSASSPFFCGMSSPQSAMRQSLHPAHPACCFRVDKQG